MYFIYLVVLIACSVQAISVCKDGGGAGVQTYATSVAVDTNSSVYTVGAINIFGLHVTNNLSVNIGGRKLGGVGSGLQSTGFIAKFNPITKATEYLKQITLSTPADQPSATIDSIVFGNGKLYIAGQLYGQGNIFGCAGLADLYNGGVYIAQLDLNAKCERITFIGANAFTPILLADSAAGHLYLYGNNVYGNITFATHKFTAPGQGSAVFIAQLSWLLSYGWILRVTTKGPGGDYQYITAMDDFGQDTAHIYGYVQADNSLQFCNMAGKCTQTNLSANNNVLIKVNKVGGSHSNVILDSNVPTYLEAFSIAARSTAGGVEIFIGGGDANATVTKYSETGGKQWVAIIPNECCDGIRNIDSYVTSMRFDSVGNVYAAGTTLSGTGARFSVSQPFVAKVQRTNGQVLFNTRASRDVTNPPDPYSGSAGLAVDTLKGEAYLVGEFGCTLKWGSTKLTTPSTNCGGINSPSGRNTYMFVVSVNTTSGAAC